ncbi:Thiamine-monophosphate kinase [Arsenophonus endosymbiont of Bemisia tabaci Q2]|nr:Thiamine-monophosphate kinase [Arsenophonus endosymbiont of Bemisia tabaci Q2]
MGDSPAGLAILQSQLVFDDVKDRHLLIQRHLRPQPRILQGQALLHLASSAIDISDGLISDLGDILKISGRGAKIKLDSLPVSEAFCRPVTSEQALTCGR